MNSLHIGFLGAGSMAESMIEGMIAKTFITPEQIILLNRIDIKRLEDLQVKYNVETTQDYENIVTKSDVIILAMKPKDAENALMSLKPYVTENHLIISVIAGITTTYIEACIGPNIPVIRAMPNTSAAIGLSATAISSGHYSNTEQESFAASLFETIGTIVHVSEDQLDTVTGLSGSGPAYFYYMVECMERAANLNGLDKETARDLIIQTMTGAAMMLSQTKQSPSLLREKVTSPGGTTHAGLSILKNYKFDEAVLESITGARKRSEELGHSLIKEKRV
ncbi:pyrroline-5-carboxylate reductase [Alkalihalobacillus sp. CinArs1]|uniref:pyrroline-5-carboxylate reductase n=1 Tax=Alkalihalobacillus sp. CinArs1 TaxID=2995314 RepID=UPI0022DDF2A0|nr:pyrroline-5-carboxylate reductase [Alkalihalobacillus sp. CinArs1]